MSKEYISPPIPTGPAVKVKKKILVVDDNLEILEVVEIILSSEGFEVKLVSDGSDVDSVVECFHPNIIILDVDLGVSDGREICAKLKHAEKTNSIPIIMFSANHSLQSIRLQGCKADDFISKPFELEEFILVVQKYFSE